MYIYFMEKSVKCMQAVFETIFDVIYLATVIFLGIQMIRKCRTNRQFFLFGIMGIILGVGDAFHLVPRAVALCTADLTQYTAALGIGKLVSSITTAIYYTMLYHVWRIRYQVRGKQNLSLAVYLLLALRIVLCLMPQNGWTSADAPLSWGIYRNIPFVILGVLLMVLLYGSAKKQQDLAFRWMWLAVAISFICYIPVVLFAESVPAVGMLMLPKACAYIWAMAMAYRAMQQENVVICSQYNRYRAIR